MIDNGVVAASRPGRAKWFAAGVLASAAAVTGFLLLNGLFASYSATPVDMDMPKVIIEAN